MSKNQNKHNPYLRLFTRDIEGSPKVNSLSMEASGLYFRLLNRLTEPPVPGSIALHEWEPHHTWQRSLTQQCLATADKYERLPYFAKLLTRYFQWKSKDILKSLKELYFYGIIVIEEDRLIQPRMYRDNGYKLETDPVEDNNIDPATGAELDPEKDHINTYKSKEKNNSNLTRTGTRASRAEFENENNNISNVKGVQGELSASSHDQTRNKPFTPPTQEEVIAFCQEKGYTFNPVMFWNHYEANGWVQGKGKPIKSWKACCSTWQQRETSGEFSPQKKQKQSTSSVPPAQSFDNTETW